MFAAFWKKGDILNCCAAGAALICAGCHECLNKQMPGGATDSHNFLDRFSSFLLLALVDRWIGGSPMNSD